MQEFASRAVSPDTGIRNLIGGWHEAVVSRDLTRIMSHYAPNVVAFDAIWQLQFKGVEAYRAHWQQCLEMCNEMLFEIHHLETTAAGGIGFAHYLARCGGTGPDGERKMGWMRVTVCARQENGRWLIAHEHFSAPFDPVDGKALLQLEP